jgi:hypothetical protein
MTCAGRATARVAYTQKSIRARNVILCYTTSYSRKPIWHERLVGILQAGVEQQNWPHDLDPTTTASAIIALVEGAS